MTWSATRALRRFLDSPVATVVQTSAILHCINEYAFGITTCAGPSMLPTFNLTGDVLFVDKFSPRRGNVERGDVVIANTPQNAKQMVCKRVIAMEGETVFVHSRSWLSGERLQTVPPGHVWLEGDNASNSTDSRYYGPVPLAMVRGRVFLKAWPLTELGSVPRYVPASASQVVGGKGDDVDDGDEEGGVGTRIYA